MDIKINQNPLKVSAKFHKQLNQQIKQKRITEEDTQITLNFRDLSYYNKQGGYHPIEISMQKDQSTGNWDLLYITDFAYYGYPYPELATEFDFNFSMQTFFMIGCAGKPLSHPEVKEFYKLWQSNFTCYLESGAFDEIVVNSW
ncbi:DUF2787 domain-containing protein [Psychromonas antarctica]|uniref:DUF2787 domain-containing protein n=1 Tax=Psychromonas antarctica TaxID=67573 RepID=UPI001EE80D6D|nr:DUF2787 domain-containing protein [Psychromonas antarctica]MCG6200030.1 DUF2787 domain-containing protein [Psychromonas antarctica]